MRACENIPPTAADTPEGGSGNIASSTISGHIEPDKPRDIGTPAPCQTHPGAPSLRAEIYSQTPRPAGEPVKPLPNS